MIVSARRARWHVDRLVYSLPCGLDIFRVLFPRLADMTMVACQVFLLNRSLHAKDLSTGLFERIRSEHLFPASG